MRRNFKKRERRDYTTIAMRDGLLGLDANGRRLDVPNARIRRKKKWMIGWSQGKSTFEEPLE